MNIQSEYMAHLFGALLLVSSTQVYAIPFLSFHGSTDYDATTGLLSIDAVLTGSVDIAPTPDLAGSNLSLQASFDSSSSGTFVTTGFFGTAPGAPDLSIVEGNTTTLLEGEILDIVMSSANGLDFGGLFGHFSPSAGSLLGDFGDPSGLFALVLNLTTVFSSTMFDSDFSGEADGQIIALSASPGVSVSAIPEPDTLVLLVMGLFGLVASKKHFNRHRLLITQNENKSWKNG